MKDLEKIQRLVGDITAEDLKYVDCAICDVLGIFVPSTGFCQYAIKYDHRHPSYMFNLFVVSDQKIVEPKYVIPDNHFLACVLSPGVPHVEQNDGNFNRYYAIMIDKNYFENIYAGYSQKALSEFLWDQFIIAEDVLFYVKQFIVEYENTQNCSEAILLNLSSIITHEFVRGILNQENERESASGIFGIEKAQQYMQQNFGKKITITQLAALANMSVSHFDRVFKQECGYSPFQYLLILRIEKAKMYLKMNQESITGIALLCGFSSASHFSSYFQKNMGIKPSEYKKIFNNN